MSNNLNTNNKKMIHLLQTTNDTDAENKKYVDDNKVDVSNYLKVDGTNKMTGNLNMDSKKIDNLNKIQQMKKMQPIKNMLILWWLLLMLNQVISKTNLHF